MKHTGLFGENTNQVDFIIAGCAKSGTTALEDIFDQHPDIYMSPIKETDYFFQGFQDYKHLLAPNGERRTGKVKPHDLIDTPEKYNNLFSKSKPGQLIGEASPLYLLDDKIPERIHQYNPAMKVILILRTPSEVAWANFVMQCRDGSESISVDNTMGFLDDTRYQADSLHPFSRHLDIPRYRKHIPEYVRVFGENLHIVLFEDFLRDKSAILNELYTFLDIPFNDKAKTDNIKNISGMPKSIWVRNLLQGSTNLKKLLSFFLPKKIRRNLRATIEARNTGKKVKMPEVVRRSLDQRYATDRDYVEHDLGINISSWKTKLSKDDES